MGRNSNSNKISDIWMVILLQNMLLGGAQSFYVCVFVKSLYSAVDFVVFYVKSTAE